MKVLVTTTKESKTFNSKESLKLEGFTFNSVEKTWSREFASKEEFLQFEECKFRNPSYVGRKGVRFNLDIEFEVTELEEMPATTNEKVVGYAKNEIENGNGAIILASGEEGSFLDVITDMSFIDQLKSMTHVGVIGNERDLMRFDFFESLKHHDHVHIHRFKGADEKQILLITPCHLV